MATLKGGRLKRFTVRHGAGYTEAYFPDHRNPDNFAAHCEAAADERPAFYHSMRRKKITGDALLFETGFDSEDQIRAFLERMNEKFAIDALSQ